jgi:hypothetical protein
MLKKGVAVKKFGSPRLDPTFLWVHLCGGTPTFQAIRAHYTTSTAHDSAAQYRKKDHSDIGMRPDPSMYPVQITSAGKLIFCVVTFYAQSLLSLHLPPCVISSLLCSS